MVYIEILVVVLISFVFIKLALMYFADERRRRKKPPYVGSYMSHKKILIQNKTKLSGEKVLDMGCGDGGILRFFIDNLGYKRGVGYDIRRVPILAGKLIDFIGKYDITLYNKDFLTADIKEYDTIYLFLRTDVVASLEEHIKKNIKPGAVVITNTFHFPNRKPFDMIKNKKGKIVFQVYRL